jgi:hypothetical protein
MTFRVTCLLTKGGRRETAEVLWTRDMSEGEYDRYLDQQRESWSSRDAARIRRQPQRGNRHE